MHVYAARTAGGEPPCQMMGAVAKGITNGSSRVVPCERTAYVGAWMPESWPAYCCTEPVACVLSSVQMALANYDVSG